MSKVIIVKSLDFDIILLGMNVACVKCKRWRKFIMVVDDSALDE